MRARPRYEVRPFERVDLHVSHALISADPASIESEFHEALSVPGTIRKTLDAQRRGADAVIIDCMGNPGLHACRDVVSISVLGPCQTSLHVTVLEIGADPDRLQDALTGESAVAVRDDHAEVVVPGCASVPLTSAVARRHRCIQYGRRRRASRCGNGAPG